MEIFYTGFGSLDKHLKIYKGNLVVVGGKPAIGKTCFLCSMIEKTIDKQKIIFFAMRTNRHKAVDRLNMLNVMENENFYLFDDMVDFEELLMIVAEYKIKYDIDAVFIDNAVDFFNDSYYSEKEITIKLKKLAEKLNVAILIADGQKCTYKRQSCYIDLRHKSLIKYADKIITINRPDRTATEKEIIDGLVEKNVAEIMIDKDMDEYYSPWIKLKFDSNNFTFNEIP